MAFCALSEVKGMVIKMSKDQIVYLRKLEEKDAKGMLEWMQDTEIQKKFRFAIENVKKEDVLNFIKVAETEPIEGKSIHYAIADEDDEYLGTISLKDVDLLARKAEYAISLRRKAQGMGVGTKATMKILEEAFDRFGLERVYLNVLSDNERAIHLYEKCGFIYEGEFRNHLFLRGEYKSLKWYSMLKEDYKVNRGGVKYRIYVLRPPVSLLQFEMETCNREVA